MEKQESAIAQGPGGQARLVSLSILASLSAAAVPVTLEAALIYGGRLLDLFWVGRAGPQALAAVVAGASLVAAFGSLAMGLAYGGLAVAARHIGERDEKAASRAAFQTIVLCTLLSAALAALGLSLAGSLLALLGLAAEVQALGLAYLQISFVGLLPSMLLHTTNALLRIARRPFPAKAAMALAAGLGVTLEPFLIFGWGSCPRLGIAGAALATLLAQSLAVALQLRCLVGGRSQLRLRRETLRLVPGTLARILRLGLPTSAQLALRALSRVVLVIVVGWFGSAAVASFGLAHGILMAILLPSYGLGNASANLVVQSLRRGQAARAWRSAWLAGTANVAYMGAVVAALFAVAPRAIAAFSADPEIIAHGADALRIASLGYVSSSLGVVMARGYDATGHKVPVALTHVLTLWGVQIPVAVLLARSLGLGGVWLGLAAGGLATGILMSYRFRRGRWATY